VLPEIGLPFPFIPSETHTQTVYTALARVNLHPPRSNVPVQRPRADYWMLALYPSTGRCNRLLGVAHTKAGSQWVCHPARHATTLLSRHS
jgi:hypothetical protein